MSEEEADALAELNETLDALAEESEVPSDNYERASELMSHPDQDMTPRLERAQIFATLAVADAVRELTEIINDRFPYPEPPPPVHH